MRVFVFKLNLKKGFEGNFAEEVKELEKEFYICGGQISLHFQKTMNGFWLASVQWHCDDIAGVVGLPHLLLDPSVSKMRSSIESSEMMYEVDL